MAASEQLSSLRARPRKPAALLSIAGFSNWLVYRGEYIDAYGCRRWTSPEKRARVRLIPHEGTAVNYDWLQRPKMFVPAIKLICFRVV